MRDSLRNNKNREHLNNKYKDREEIELNGII